MSVVHEIVHPFCRIGYVDGTRHWTIGCEIEDGTWYCQGEGLKIIEEISRYTPPRYGEKVFFTVRYIDPDGNDTSRKKLKMLGAKAFERRVSGFYHPYEVEATE